MSADDRPTLLAIQHVPWETQLLARALGAEVRPGERSELGFAPVEILDPNDPVLAPLVPSTTVLHWHGDVFDLPEGARPRLRQS